MGQIQDISMGGVCVRYLATNASYVEHSTIKIFGTNDRFIQVDRVQCRIVYDHEIPEGSWEQISTKRCGVEFENLDVGRQLVLLEFIDHFASDET